MIVIAGPCVLDNYGDAVQIARECSTACSALGCDYYFKASWDKANRTSITSYRGPGMSAGLNMLAQVREAVGCKVLTDVHQPYQVDAVADVVDVIQIPALLCRQTDLVVAVARTGKRVNVKKGQFQAPWDMIHVVEKIRTAGNDRIWITERGSMYGYNNLTVDMRSFSYLRDTGCPVVFDATHSCQLPGGMGVCSGGGREFIPVLARAAVAAGVDGVFMEVHPNPDEAKCDGPNSLRLEDFRPLLAKLVEIDGICKVS